jgi:hypothetical protein
MDHPPAGPIGMIVYGSFYPLAVSAGHQDLVGEVMVAKHGVAD